MKSMVQIDESKNVPTLVQNDSKLVQKSGKDTIWSKCYQN